MASWKGLLLATGFLVTTAIVLGLGPEVMSRSTALAPGGEARADLIWIDAIAEQRELEMAPAQFLHDKHVKIVRDRGKDCFVCHKTKGDSNKPADMSLKFMRLEDGDAGELKELYHQACISCHAADAAAKAPEFGPQAGECRKCHVEKPAFADGRQPVSMTNALHAKHWGSELIPADKGQQTNCGACHHEYDAAAKQLVYVQYQEESCRACHTESPQGDVKKNSMDAFHGECVVCHLSLQEAKAEKFGPTTCAGCHDKDVQASTKANLDEMLQKLGGELPRLPRKQPDAVLMVQFDASAPNQIEEQRGLMPVAFNHKAHEGAVESCSSCHHKSLKACSECHTSEGAEEGGFIRLEQAMHKADSGRSCVGCHAVKQAQPTCAGCHASLPPRELDESACGACHLHTAAPGGASSEAADPLAFEQLGAPPVTPTLPLPADKAERQALAANIVNARAHSQVRIDVNAIPEKVVIGSLAKEYKPSEMPHRQIVLKMLDDMKNDPLANFFHASETTVCQACHHNSPTSATPPSCKSCHGKASFQSQPGRPSLKAAYHGQCMGCHKEMRLEKPVATDCVACHAQRDQ